MPGLLLAPGCGLPQGKLPFMSVIRVFPASNGASSHLRVKATERKVGLEQVPSNWNAAKKLSSSTLATQTFWAQLQKAPTLLCLFGLKTRQSKQRQPFLKACNFFKTTDVQTSGHRTLCKSSAPCTTGPFCLWALPPASGSWPKASSWLGQSLSLLPHQPTWCLVRHLWGMLLHWQTFAKEPPSGAWWAHPGRSSYPSSSFSRTSPSSPLSSFLQP